MKSLFGGFALALLLFCGPASAAVHAHHHSEDAPPGEQKWAAAEIPGGMAEHCAQPGGFSAHDHMSPCACPLMILMPHCGMERCYAPLLPEGLQHNNGPNGQPPMMAEQVSADKPSLWSSMQTPDEKGSRLPFAPNPRPPSA